MWRTAPSVSSVVSCSLPAMDSSWPFVRMDGRDGTLRWRSEPPTSTRWVRAALRSKAMHPRSAGRAGALSVVDGTPSGPHGGRWVLRSGAARGRGVLRRRGRVVAPRVALGDVAELLGLRERLQLLQRLVLDLADALARDVERPPDLVERARVLAAEPVAELEDAALAVGEVLQRLAQRLLREDLGGALVGRLGALVGDELPELRLLLVADRLLERHRGLCGALDRVDLHGVDPRDLGDLVGGRLPAQLRDELALGAADLVELLDDVDGDADRPRLVGQGARDRLADPPGRVGRELEALAVVELLGRADEAERPLLDQVEERQALVAVVLGDRDDEAQVR